MSEKPVHPRPRRLAEWLNPTGAKKEHSLIDKVYNRKNLERAWESVRRNQGAGGIDGQSIAAFEEHREEHLERLAKELSAETYQPAPVKQVQIPKRGGKPGEKRTLGIPIVASECLLFSGRLECRLVAKVFGGATCNCGVGSRQCGLSRRG